jgi:hypothetical protein
MTIFIILYLIAALVCAAICRAHDIKIERAQSIKTHLWEELAVYAIVGLMWPLVAATQIETAVAKRMKHGE